ncbi:MAG TPA: hypothetical protein VK824_09340 [Planctomycetota bacterium]|nr:hypothetical protein [Planctomycetota bacterium]
MHYLTRQRLHLSRFHPLMKVLLSLYILSVAGAVYVATLKYSERAEWSGGGVAEYVAGNGGADAAADAFGDPLAGTPEGRATHEGLSRRQLIDIVHPHLFSVPIVLFILGHLLHLTRLPDWLKLAINAGAFLSFFATFLLPFVIRSERALAPLLVVSGCVMLLCFALLCIIPLWETWLGKPGERDFDAIPRLRREG